MKLATVALLLSMGIAQANVDVPISSIMSDINGTSTESAVETASEEEPAVETTAEEEPATMETLTSSSSGSFNRISTFFVCTQLDADCNVDDETSAETIWVTKDHNTLVYTDSPGERVGFIDITDAASPEAAGFVDLPGEPTTVRIHGNYGKHVHLVLCCVNCQSLH